MFFVYAIKSILNNQVYKGQANSLDKRIDRHNKGYVKSTKERRPWELIAFQGFQTREEARWQEFLLKESHGCRATWLTEFAIQAPLSEGFRPGGGSTPEGERIQPRPS